MSPPSPSKSRKDRASVVGGNNVLKSRACDACRRRKSKCDGSKKQDNICSNCVTANNEPSTPRGPPKAYVTALEDRLEQLEQLLKQARCFFMPRVRPDTDFSAELGPPIARDSWKDDDARASMKDTPAGSALRLSTRLALNAHARRAGTDSDSSSDESDLDQFTNLIGVKSGHILSPTDAIPTRFHGKSSVVSLVATAKQYKDLHMSDTAQEANASRSATKRPEFWSAHPWEKEFEGFNINVEQVLVSAVAEFPPPSLAGQLIDLYFIHVNAQLPLLHRPTFERQFRDNLHHRNVWFNCVCLGIFAVASRWCDDPLVLPRNCNRTSSGGLDWTCAGWHYHTVAMGIYRIRQSLLFPACLEEIQAYSLLSAFVRGTINHSASWIFISIGLRKAQDLGAHRKKVYSKTPSVEAELTKRAFWCLVAYDRFASAILGRPCAIGEEDFDLDLCLEIDDEYWDTADPPFRQPPGVPCRVTYFNLWLRLAQIVTFTVKTIYAVHNPRALLGRIAKSRTEEVIAQLNLALQEWLDSSASLHTTYQLARMLIYRPFIPPIPSASASLTPQINVSVPAMKYCIDAARSSARIIEVQVARGWTNTPILIAVSQLSAAILTLAVWNAKAGKQDVELEDVKPPVAQTITSLLDDIAVFFNALEWVQTRWENVPNLILVLKRALPEDISPPVSSMRPSTPTQLHESDSEIWTLPYHASSIRTGQALQEGRGVSSKTSESSAYTSYPMHLDQTQDHS
ncbi:fungal-specific transcription factor domain-containing protein [Mycena filopes]|nr:fungal-specific transcription factor domain-containing protein [Mycena filopes]